MNSTDKLFDMFKTPKQQLFSVDQFLQALQDSNMNQYAQILIHLLQNTKQKELTRGELNDLFNLDLKDPQLVEAIFQSFSKNKINHITLDELKTINAKNQLGYNQNDLNLIIKYIGTDNKINLQTLQRVLNEC